MSFKEKVWEFIVITPPLNVMVIVVFVTFLSVLKINSLNYVYFKYSVDLPKHEENRKLMGARSCEPAAVG